MLHHSHTASRTYSYRIFFPRFAASLMVETVIPCLMHPFEKQTEGSAPAVPFTVFAVTAAIVHATRPLRIASFRI